MKSALYLVNTVLLACNKDIHLGKPFSLILPSHFALIEGDPFLMRLSDVTSHLMNRMAYKLRIM